MIDEELKEIKTNFLKKVKDNLYLRPNEINILEKNNIDYNSCATLSNLIYLIETRLSQEENNELENLSYELSERNYYENTNK